LVGYNYTEGNIGKNIYKNNLDSLVDTLLKIWKTLTNSPL